MKQLEGNIYRNDITGHQWRLLSTNNDGTEIILSDKRGHTFRTNKHLMVNYSYIGLEFSGKRG